MGDRTAGTGGMTAMRRIALIGATANPNFGDDAILEATLDRIDAAFGRNAIVLVLTKDAGYTRRMSGYRHECAVVPTDALHRLTVACGYSFGRVMEAEPAILGQDGAAVPAGVSQGLVDEVSGLFSGGLDMLHVIGGGYVNSLWPDMLAEVHVAASLARAEGARVVLTGQDMLPADFDDAAAAALSDVLSMAEVADFRDGSHAGVGAEGRCGCVTETCDDLAIPPSPWLPARGFAAGIPAPAPYGNVCIVGGLSFDGDDDRRERMRVANEVAAFVRGILRKGAVARVNVLELSPGDSDLLMRALSGVGDKVGVARLWDMPVCDAAGIVARAEWNAGERFHLAVLSLAAGVPCMSWHGNGYYENKMVSAYAPWGLGDADAAVPLLVPVSDLTAEAIDRFVAADVLHGIRVHLAGRRPEVEGLMSEKLSAVASAYAASSDEGDRLREATCGLLRDPSVPDVSIIVPVYNAARYITACLDSLLAQEGCEIEVICVDDGSVDRSPIELSVRSWADPRVRVIRQPNMGVSAARNVGVAAARGRHIMFCDADDWYADSRVVADLSEAADVHGAPIVAGRFEEHPEGREPIRDWQEGSLARYDFPRPGRVNADELQFDFGWIRCLYDRRLLADGRHPFIDRAYYEDPVWFMQVMTDAGWLWALDRPVYCYRTGHKEDSNFFKSPSARQSIDLLHGLLDNIRTAREHGMGSLEGLSVARLTCAYSAPLLHILHAEGEVADEARQAIEEIGEYALGPGGGIRLISEMAWFAAERAACAADAPSDNEEDPDAPDEDAGSDEGEQPGGDEKPE